MRTYFMEYIPFYGSKTGYFMSQCSPLAIRQFTFMQTTETFLFILSLDPDENSDRCPW